MKTERNFVSDNTSLTSRLEALEHSHRALEHSNMMLAMAMKTLLQDDIKDREKDLKQAKLIEEFETYSRIIHSM
jgi:hypothetical protein